MSTITSPHPARNAIRSAAAARAAFAAAALALLALVLLAHGFLPGLVNDGPWSYLLEGDMRCAHDMGLGALRSWCGAYGIPAGYPYLSSGPVVLVGWALMWTGMGADAAYLLTGVAFDALALAGGYGLMRMLGAGRAVALGTAAAYLLAPTVVGLHAFGGTFTGFTLLPAYALADLVAMRAVEDGGRQRIAVALAGYAAVRTGALFLDGYSFVGSALIGGLLWLQWVVRTPAGARRRLLGCATFVSGQLVAAGTYLLYAPRLSAVAPLELFRAMGLDVVTLARPTRMLWGADALGLAWDPARLWGDGSNATYNYLGVACVALALVAVVRRRRQPHVLALAAAGAVALVLSLGPSLKAGEERPPLGAHVTYESYLMPAGAAAAELPWGGAFTALPGFDQLRATYRWSGVTRLALVVLAGLAIDGLVRRRPRRALVLAVALALLALAELAPNLPLLRASYRANAHSRAALTAAVVPPLAGATEPGERVFFLSADGAYNDYLANYLVTAVGGRSFNAGGDKNAAFAQRGWPPAIGAMAPAGRSPETVRAALAAGDADVVVAPYFDLRWAAYAWPPSDADRLAARRAFAPLLADRRLAVRRFRWFATLRLRDAPAAPASGSAP
jgi:hypothetical protein